MNLVSASSKTEQEPDCPLSPLKNTFLFFWGYVPCFQVIGSLLIKKEYFSPPLANVLNFFSL